MCRFLSKGIIMAMMVLLCAGTQPALGAEMAEDMAVSIAEDYDVDWLWGDVVSKTASSVTIQYLDYEDDIEKQMTVTVDDNTSFENVASLAEIQIGDTLSVDYVMQENGDGLAQLISKEEALGADESESTATIEGDILEPASGESGVSSIPVE